MTGGRGNDSYYVEQTGDKVIEYAGALEGTADKVFSTIDYTLPIFVEQLFLQGSAIFGTGNGDPNTIEGTAGLNIIDGKGGADTMTGWGGDDIYYVDNSGDKVIEYAGSTQGNDVVIASIDYYQMTDNVETLYLVGSVGSIGIGNTGNNSIIGNDQVNIIDGGLGNDTMTGRGGNDYYIVDSVLDKVVEDVGGGYDTVNSYVSYAAPANVEKIYLVGPWAYNATGGTVNNEIYGNDLKNILDGGKGSDMLQGGGDNDTFVFRRGEAHNDLVLDFNGNGAAAGDQLKFVGYGAGASFVKVDNTHWQINDGTLHETIVFTNAATIHPTDYLWA
jgi:Ca2+-binding RTX toxin-like protein